jgi:nicotinate phosphoribosyltransferase
VRIDCGDLREHAGQVRRILDEAGLNAVRIFASGNLDEYKLRDLVNSGAPIDGFGVGTRMNTSADKPYLDCIYKLQEYAGRARRKRSEGKATWPGRKQVYRSTDETGCLRGDILTLEGDVQPGEPLLQPVMKAGRRIAPALPLEMIRQHARRQLASLPPPLRNLDRAQPYPVKITEALRSLGRSVDQRLSEDV